MQILDFCLIQVDTKLDVCIRIRLHPTDTNWDERGTEQTGSNLVSI